MQDLRVSKCIAGAHPIIDIFSVLFWKLAARFT